MKILDPIQIYGANLELKFIGRFADNNNVRKGKPSERMGRKATGLNHKRQGGRVA